MPLRGSSEEHWNLLILIVYSLLEIFDHDTEVYSGQGRELESACGALQLHIHPMPETFWVEQVVARSPHHCGLLLNQLIHHGRVNTLTGHLTHYQALNTDIALWRLILRHDLYFMCIVEVPWDELLRNEEPWSALVLQK